MNDLFNSEEEIKKEVDSSRMDEVNFIYALATKKKAGWQKSDNPCLAVNRGDLEKAWTTMSKSWSPETRCNTLQDIEFSIQAQARFRREERKAGDFVPQPRAVAVWIRAKAWLDEIESTAEMKIKQQQNETKCTCGNPTMGAMFKTCQDCLPDPWAEDRKAYAEENGLKRKPDEPRVEWFARLKRIAKQTSQNIGE